MFLRQFLDDRHGCASYLIACDASKDAAIVDPGIDVARDERVLDERGFRLGAVIDTHVHADHVSGAGTLARRHGAALRLHRLPPVAYDHDPLDDGDEIRVGSLRGRTLHTPGHRPELVSLLLSHPDRSPEPVAVFTGDSLLAGDAGRPDFSGGDAAAQHRSLGRLLALPDWVMVLPGHVAGPGGASMSDARIPATRRCRRVRPRPDPAGPQGSRAPGCDRGRRGRRRPGMNPRAPGTKPGRD